MKGGLKKKFGTIHIPQLNYNQSSNEQIHISYYNKPIQSAPMDPDIPVATAVSEASIAGVDPSL
jgi:hypothetical protein